MADGGQFGHLVKTISNCHEADGADSKGYGADLTSESCEDSDEMYVIIQVLLQANLSLKKKVKDLEVKLSNRGYGSGDVEYSKERIREVSGKSEIWLKKENAELKRQLEYCQSRANGSQNLNRRFSKEMVNSQGGRRYKAETDSVKYEDSKLRLLEKRSYPKRLTQEVSEKNKYQKCKYCGVRHHIGSEFCRAFGKTCHKCMKQNHFARRCWTNIRNSKSNRVWKTCSEADEKGVTPNKEVEASSSPVGEGEENVDEEGWMDQIGYPEPKEKVDNIQKGREVILNNPVTGNEEIIDEKRFQAVMKLMAVQESRETEKSFDECLKEIRIRFG